MEVTSKASEAGSDASIICSVRIHMYFTWGRGGGGQKPTRLYPTTKVKIQTKGHLLRGMCVRVVVVVGWWGEGGACVCTQYHKELKSKACEAGSGSLTLFSVTLYVFGCYFLFVCLFVFRAVSRKILSKGFRCCG